MSNKKGFTLVEVIISIAALGLICAVLLRLFVVAGNTNSKAGDMQGAGLVTASVVETLAGADSLNGGLSALGAQRPDDEGSWEITFIKDGYDVTLKFSKKGDYPGALYDISVEASREGKALSLLDTSKYYKEGRDD
jgi:prepilin-type N-terminal cleavage/methylation domain-containing protein